MLRRTVLTAALAGLLALPAVAHADAFDDVLADYQGDERITACKHGGEKLLEAKEQLPGDIGQFAPGFPKELDKAIATASEGCDDDAAGKQIEAATTTGTTATTSTTATTATTQTTPTVPDPAAAAGQTQPPATTTPPAAETSTTAAATTPASDDDDGLPPGAIAGIVAGALVLLLLLVWGLARFFAWDPVWLARSRHALAEAGWHTSGVWEDFTDWLRGGRPRRT